MKYKIEKYSTLLLFASWIFVLLSMSTVQIFSRRIFLGFIYFVAAIIPVFVFVVYKDIYEKTMKNRQTLFTLILGIFWASILFRWLFFIGQFEAVSWVVEFYSATLFILYLGILLLIPSVVLSLIAWLKFSKKVHVKK